MALIIEVEVERVLTAPLLGEDTDLQTLLSTRAGNGWTLESSLNIKAGAEALLFFERQTQGPPP